MVHARSEQGAMLKLARLPQLEEENERLRASLKKYQEESDSRFEQVCLLPRIFIYLLV